MYSLKHRDREFVLSCLPAFWGNWGAIGGLGLQGNQADNRTALGDSAHRLQSSFYAGRPSPPLGVVDSGHQDNTGQCHEEGSCEGGWAGGYVQRGPEMGQLGGLARHGLLPAAPWGSKPCHRHTPYLTVPSARFPSPGSQFELRIRAEGRNPGEAYHGSGLIC